MLKMVTDAIKGVYASVFYADSKAYMTATSNIIDQEKDGRDPSGSGRQRGRRLLLPVILRRGPLSQLLPAQRREGTRRRRAENCRRLGNTSLTAVLSALLPAPPRQRAPDFRTLTRLARHTDTHVCPRHEIGPV